MARAAGRDSRKMHRPAAAARACGQRNEVTSAFSTAAALAMLKQGTDHKP
jgi:hypothetical protein